MLALAGVLLFSGLLLASMAPIAAARARRSREWSEAVAALELSPNASVAADGKLVAVRGVVESDAPLEDPVTGKAVVWFEVEVKAGQSTTSIVQGATPFLLRDESDVAWVDPEGARDVAVRIDEFEPGHDRKRVARFLKKRGLANRADVSLIHRCVAVGDQLVVVGRGDRDARAPRASNGATYREGEERTIAFAAGSRGELVLTTHSLEALRERELASVTSGTAGVVILAVLGLGCAAAGGVLLMLEL